MSNGFEAIKALTIDAPPATVWEALTEPAKVRLYMHGTTISTDWSVGGPVSWSGEWKGKAYIDKGTVLAFEPEQLLRYTHWSPMGGSEDVPENYHTVTFKLKDDGGRTILTLIQDNNATQDEADAMAENNWGPMLEGLRNVAEEAAGP